MDGNIPRFKVETFLNVITWFFLFADYPFQNWSVDTIHQKQRMSNPRKPFTIILFCNIVRNS